jgi:hypothetical protein
MGDLYQIQYYAETLIRGFQEGYKNSIVNSVGDLKKCMANVGKNKNETEKLISKEYIEGKEALNYYSDREKCIAYLEKQENWIRATNFIDNDQIRKK